ncbi:MAG TPA: Spy/CpxP family protein refolding chaperone [Longimicrobiales bacterium]|nr:Spy/CpxP family protein refolding chaperone [Longimicrobiales bacterium]
MKRLVIAAFLLLAPVAGHAQQSGTDQERRAAFEARRDSLEAEVVQKFVRRLGRELKLSSAQQSQTEQVLRQSGLQRRELSRASMQLRGRIYRAARSAETPEAEFVRLIAEHEALRVREHDLWRRDQEQLARILDPRQRAQFILSWAHFQDDMRDILSRRMREQSDSRDRSNDKPRDESDHSRDPDRRDHNH